MRKRCMILLLSLGVLFSVSGCGDSKTMVSIDAEPNENVTTAKQVYVGEDSLQSIGDGLYYDMNTRIVYWWNGKLDNGFYSATTPTPYYASNGLPYKYNPETNTLVEISEGIE